MGPSHEHQETSRWMPQQGELLKVPSEKDFGAPVLARQGRGCRCSTPRQMGNLARRAWAHVTGDAAGTQASCCHPSATAGRAQGCGDTSLHWQQGPVSPSCDTPGATQHPAEDQHSSSHLDIRHSSTPTPKLRINHNPSAPRGASHPRLRGRGWVWGRCPRGRDSPWGRSAVRCGIM